MWGKSGNTMRKLHRDTIRISSKKTICPTWYGLRFNTESFNWLIKISVTQNLPAKNGQTDQEHSQEDAPRKPDRRHLPPHARLAGGNQLGWKRFSHPGLQSEGLRFLLRVQRCSNHPRTSVQTNKTTGSFEVMYVFSTSR